MGETLLLLDGTQAAYRAFYAIRDLSTSAGRPTNALFGFVRMLGQLKRHFGPSHQVVVFDGGLSKERLALLDTYKAQRAPMPDRLREQLDAIAGYVRLAGLRQIRIPGQEADDVLAAAAAQWGGNVERVLIVSSDKDFFQLVDEKVRVVRPSKTMEELDENGVEMKTGVRPDQFVGWLALVGDSSDNIPGVPGVGPKTAARLLRTYGSLDALLAAGRDVAPARIGNALNEHAADVRRNVEMVRLKADIELPFSWPDAAVGVPDDEGLLAFLTEMEFESMAREVRERLSSLPF